MLAFTLVSDRPSQLFGGMYCFLSSFSLVSFGFASRRSLLTSPASCTLMSGPFSSSRARSFVSFSIIAGLESVAFCHLAGGSSDSFLSESSPPESPDSELLSWASGLFESCISFPRSAKPVLMTLLSQRKWKTATTVKYLTTE